MAGVESVAGLSAPFGIIAISKVDIRQRVDCISMRKGVRVQGNRPLRVLMRLTYVAIGEIERRRMNQRRCERGIGMRRCEICLVCLRLVLLKFLEDPSGEPSCAAARTAG